jgi:hypothetical protein
VQASRRKCLEPIWRVFCEIELSWIQNAIEIQDGCTQFLPFEAVILNEVKDPCISSLFFLSYFDSALFVLNSTSFCDDPTHSVQ